MNKPRNFNFDIPLHCGPGVSDRPEFKMDGLPLRGVTDLTIRAGYKGFTNVVINFETDAAVELTASLLARVDCSDDDKAFFLSEVYKQAKLEIDEDLEREGSELDSELYAQAKFVSRIIELILENR